MNMSKSMGQTHSYVSELDSASIVGFCDYVGWSNMSSSAIDFYYRMYSFHFEIKKIRFKAKAFKDISFLTETASIYSLSWAIQHSRRSQNMTCFGAILFGFCITIH